MTSQSHLYQGFRHVGALSSVHFQREDQKTLLASLPGSRLLVVGSGYGHEAEHILDSDSQLRDLLDVTIIDLVDVSVELLQRSGLSMLNSKLRFNQRDILDASRVDGYGMFDIAQCGFVLHDIRPNEKDRAMQQLAGAVRGGGHIIISDIFSLGSGAHQVALDVYDSFIRETIAARAVGRLSTDAYDELMGDGACSGLLRSREEAISGVRDYFESVAELIARALRAGLRLVSVSRNPDNKFLAVLVFVRMIPGRDDVAPKTEVY